MKLSIFKEKKIITVLMMGLVLCNPVTARAEEPSLTATVTEGSGTAFIDDYMGDEALTSSSRAVAAEYFGIDSKDVQLLADFGVSFSEDATLPASVTVSGVFDKSYAWSAKDGITLFSVDDKGYTDKVSYIYADGDIRFTVNSAGHFFVAKDSGDSLRQTELKSSVNGYTITAAGNMPKGAVLKVKRVYKTAQLEEIIGDENYKICAAFDIEILVDGQVWQPAAFGETVTITAANIDIPGKEELKVYRIEDAAIEDPDHAPVNAITELDASLDANGNIEVETEHFTIYTFGSGDTLVDIEAGDDEKIAYLTAGPTFNQRIKRLADSSAATSDSNTTITKILWTTDAFDDTADGATTVSMDESPYGVYARLDGEIVYLYSEADTIYCNINSSSMFYKFSKLTEVDLSRYNTSKVTNMESMFRGISATTLDVTGFDTSNVTNMRTMFANNLKLKNIDLSNFDTSNVTYMGYMFQNCETMQTLDLSSFDLSSLASNGSSSPFYCCYILTKIIAPKTIKSANAIPLPTKSSTKWYLDDEEPANQADSDTEYSSMINGVTNTPHIYIRNDRWNFKAAPQDAYLVDGLSFRNAIATLSGMETATLSDSGFLLDTDTNGANVVNKVVTDIIWSEEEFSTETDSDALCISTNEGLPVYARLNGTVIELYTKAETVYFNEDCSNMFACLFNKVPFTFLQNKIDTSHVTNMSKMFANCYTYQMSGTSFKDKYTTAAQIGQELDISRFDTSNVTDMSYMFACVRRYSFVFGDKFDTSHVTDMNHMFMYSNSMNSFTAEFDTSSVTDMSWMFAYTSIRRITFKTPFTTANVTNMTGMFHSSWNLVTYDFGGCFDTSKVTHMSGMFHDDFIKEIDLSSFDLTSNIAASQFTFTDMKTLRKVKAPSKIRSDQVFNFYNASGAYYLDDDDDNVADSKTIYTSLINGVDGTSHIYKRSDYDGFTLPYIITHLISGENFNYQLRKVANASAGWSDVDSTITSIQWVSEPFTSDTNLAIEGEPAVYARLNGTVIEMYTEADGVYTNADATGMFRNFTAVTNIDLNKYNTSETTNMSGMFQKCSSLQSIDISGFDTSSGTDFSYMFYDCKALTSLDVSSFDTSKVTSSTYMLTVSTLNNLQRFSAPKTSSYDIALPEKTDCAWYLDDEEPELEADKKTTYTSIIRPVTDLSHTYIRSDIDGFSINQIVTHLRAGSVINNIIKNLADNGHTYSEYCFKRTTDENGTDFVEDTITDIVWATTPFTSEVNLAISGDTPVYGRKSGTVIELYTEADDVYFNSNSESMFAGMAGLKQLSFLLDKIDTTEVTSTKFMFSGFAMRWNSKNEYVADYAKEMSLQTLDLSRFNTSNVSNMENTFGQCGNLTTLNISTFDTKNVKNMKDMFGDCCKIQTLDLSHFNTSNVRIMSGMFCNDHELAELDISSFDTAQVTDMSWMFQGLNALSSLDLSHFNTSNVTKMREMFFWAGGLQSLNLSGWDTTKVTNMEAMFIGCTHLTSLDLSSFNTSLVTNMNGSGPSANEYGMFAYCRNLTTLVLGNGFNTSQITYFGTMFKSCEYLADIDVSRFNTEKATNMGEMFAGCASLSSLDISNFVCDQASMKSFCKNSGIRSITLPSTLTHIDDLMFSGTFNLSIINNANGITTISDNAWQNGVNSPYPFFRYIYAHQDDIYAPILMLDSEVYDTDILLTQEDIDTGNYIVMSTEDIMMATQDSNFTWTQNLVITGRVACELTHNIPRLTAIARYLDNMNEASKQFIQLDDYRAISASCWHEHDWDADGITIMMYEISVPATYNLDTGAALDIAVTKYLEDADVNIGIPNEITLTNKNKSSAHITYQLLPDIGDVTVPFSTSAAPPGVTVTGNEWEDNVKTYNCSMIYNLKQDLSHASAVGVYSGDCLVTFSR